MTRADCSIVRVDTKPTGVHEVIDRSSRPVFTFAMPMHSPDYTRVSLDIVADGEGCVLTLTHEGVLPEWADARSRAGG